MKLKHAVLIVHNMICFIQLHAKFDATLILF